MSIMYLSSLFLLFLSIVIGALKIPIQDENGYCNLYEDINQNVEILRYLSMSNTISIPCTFFIPSITRKSCHENELFSDMSFLKELNIEVDIQNIKEPKWIEGKNGEKNKCVNVVKNVDIKISKPYYTNIFLLWKEFFNLTSVDITYEEVSEEEEIIFEYTRNLSVTIIPITKEIMKINEDGYKIISSKNKRNEIIEKEKNINSNKNEMKKDNNIISYAKNHITNCTFNYLNFFPSNLFNFTSYTSSFYSFLKFSNSLCENFLQSLGSRSNTNYENCFIGECVEENKNWYDCETLKSPHIFVISIVPKNFEKNCNSLMGLELNNINFDVLRKTYEFEKLPNINLNLPSNFLYPFNCVEENDE
uniref:Uncharacterized protein n=1 Tax=Parastrongyloides trichosuri TaxID=131310 RepID=A0A0N4ZR02_PARTI